MGRTALYIPLVDVHSMPKYFNHEILLETPGGACSPCWHDAEDGPEGESYESSCQQLVGNEDALLGLLSKVKALHGQEC
jgi:hypothetical protein